MTTHAPRGLGWWVAFESEAHPGPKHDDLAVLIDRCKRTGATWACLRGGDGGNDDKDTDQQSVRAFVDAGIDVYAWIFARPGRARQEAEDYKRLIEYGAKGAVINAEFEYQQVSAQEAQGLVSAIRNAGAKFVAHAPPDYAGSANVNPWNALDLACDAIMPQVYAWEHNDQGHTHHLNEVLMRYKAKGTPIEKVWPILCSYRPRFRGFDSKGKARPCPPIPNEPQRVADDLIAGLEHEWVKTSQAPSIYTLDAVTFINGSKDRVIESLENWHQSQMGAKEPVELGDGEVVGLGLKLESERLSSERDSKEWSDVS